MMRLSGIFCKPKTLAQMFRKLKLAGAHPDVLWAIDAQKAQHNGEEMIRLETLMHQRALANNSHTRKGTAERFTFWLANNKEKYTGLGATTTTTLRSVSCTINPVASTSIVKRQLAQLFRDANVYEEFELNDEGVNMDLESVLRYADKQQSEHLQQSGALYIRGDKAVEMLRRFGVLLIVEEDGITYLVTLPEIQQSLNEAPSTYTPARSLVGPNGEIDPDVQEYMREHGLRAFDLRMSGSHSSIERFVSAFERLERMYDVHRGRAMRSCVCIVLSIKSLDNYVAEDGSIVLSVQSMPTWEEFLLSLPQEVWLRCVQMHRDWRIGLAPKLKERQRQLMKVADMFHFFRVKLDSGIGSRMMDWQGEFILRLMKEEMVIRNAVRKYNLKSDLLKKRGEICVSFTLKSAVDPTKEIAYRVGGDGRLFFSYSAITTGQMLRVLKDNLRRLEVVQKEHDNAVAALEHLSRIIPVDFSVDTEWKLREEGDFVNCLKRFVQTIKANQKELSAFLTTLMNNNSAAVGVPKKRMVWVISSRFDTMASGVVFVSWDVDFESIKKLLLPKT